MCKQNLLGAVVLALCCTTGCDTQTFEKDPLCASCIEKACRDPEALTALRSHLAQANSELAAQLVSRIESHEGCNAKIDAAIIEKAYDQYAPAFFDTHQPFCLDRIRHALQSVSENKSYKASAIRYLMHYAAQITENEQALQAAQATLEPLKAENPDAFKLLATILPKDGLQQLAELDETPERNAALAPRFAEFEDEAVRNRLLKELVIIRWHMQQSGSTMLPQYLELDWGMLPMSDSEKQLAASLRVKSVTIKGEEAKKRGVYARDAFADEPLRTANIRKKRVDMGAWLKTADTYKVAAEAEVAVWPNDVSDDCLRGAETCEITPVATFPSKLEFTYRVYVGVETGAPKRNTVKADNDETTKSLNLQLCSEGICSTLWDGKITPAKSRQTLTVTQGHDFYLLADVSGAKLPVAGRLMARAMPGATWQEVATFFSASPLKYTPLVRANVDTSSVCRDKGKCSLEFQLRPSLRMARRDPAFTRYWGDTLELGKQEIDIQNRTPLQVYRSF